MADDTQTPSWAAVTLSNFTSEPPHFHARAGVYALLDADKRPLYIGQSQDMPYRVSYHKRRSWGTKIDKVLYFPCASQDERLCLETALILRYRPRHNRWIRLNLRVDGTLYETQWIQKSVSKDRASE